MVLMIAAYVEGRPIPRSSSSFTSEASLNRGGGSVKCCSGFRLFSVSFWPSVSSGSLCLSASSSRRLRVLGLFVDLKEAVEFQDRSGDSIRECLVAIYRIDVYGGLVEDGRVYLRSDEALPYELINFEFVFLKVLLHRVRMTKRRSRAYGFVCLLCPLDFVLYSFRDSGRYCRYCTLPIISRNSTKRIRTHADGIRTHVGDQTNGAFIAKFNTFVQTLRDHHRALYCEAQLARRVLLELAGGERRYWIAAALFFFNLSYIPLRFKERF